MLHLIVLWQWRTAIQHGRNSEEEPKTTHSSCWCHLFRLHLLVRSQVYSFSSTSTASQFLSLSPSLFLKDFPSFMQIWRRIEFFNTLVERELYREKGMETNSVSKVVMSLLLCIFLITRVQVIQCSVTYDKKAIIINGQRRILLSGSVHYPRSTPDVCTSPSVYVFILMKLISSPAPSGSCHIRNEKFLSCSLGAEINTVYFKIQMLIWALDGSIARLNFLGSDTFSSLWVHLKR